MLGEKKHCKKCKILLTTKNCRIRKDKRYENLIYFNIYCIECDNLIAKEYYNKHKDNIVRKYNKENKEIINIKTKRYRDSPRGKANRKLYIKKNKKKLIIQERKAKEKWAKNNPEKVKELRDKYNKIHKTSLPDGYIKYQLKVQNRPITEQNIKIKRREIIECRLKKLIKEIEKYESNK